MAKTRGVDLAPPLKVVRERSSRALTSLKRKSDS